ncbi:MAG: P-type conjugative transfer protein TrbG [Pseudomonadota bacterium]|jgi:type IV secretion system protein VirB9|nr:P-type conjugative transfer protein TrbG [Pseudomonadota bacterium]
MKSIRSAGSIALALTLGACASQPPAAPPPLNLVTEAPPEPAATPAPLTGAQLLEQQPSEVRAAIKEHQQDGKWPLYKTPQLALYPYGEDPEPIVECQPLRTTDIQLQPGETITDVAMGDTERWMATPAASGDPRNPVPHLSLKPQVAGIQTNLTIYTTKHIYHMTLRSRGSHAMQEVEFYYPDELLTARKEADSEAAKAKPEAADRPGDSDNVVKVASVEPAQLNFAYTVAGGNVPWKPIRAFDDGSHVYIQMPAGMKTSEAPALLVNAGSGTQMVNYRVAGNYYVVDRLFSGAILVSGVGRDQDRVTIRYAGGTR